MTHLELVAEIGGGLMEIVRMYRAGMITPAELENILGSEKADMVHLFYPACKHCNGTYMDGSAAEISEHKAGFPRETLFH